MKKYLLSLLCLLGAGLTAQADDFKWDYSTSATITGNKETTGTVKTGVVTWNFTASDASKVAKDGNWKGISLGGKESGTQYNPASISFTTDYFKDKKISKISLEVGCNASSTSDANQFSISVDGTSLITENLKTGSNNVSAKQTVTWEGNTICGESIGFSFKLDKAKNIIGHFGPITVTYMDATADPVDPQYVITPQTCTIEIGSIIDFPQISPSNLTYEFSTDSDIIELDKTARTIKGLAIGTATVNFSTAAVDGMYNAGSGSFEVTVKGKTPKMSFTSQVEYGKLGTGVVWRAVNVEEPADNHGAITYSSSDPEVVSVNSTTGQITKTDIKKAGTAVITATMAAEGDYAEGSASYKIIVIDPNATIQPDNTVFDFTEVNPYGMTTQTGSSYETKVKSISGENNTVKITFGGNYRSWKENNLYYLRMQKNSTLKVEVPEGYKITKIGMTGTINSGASWSPTSGTVTDSSDPDGGTFSYIWVPANDTDVQREVTFNAGSSDVSKINKINVMYDAASSDLKSANLTFTPNVNGIIVNEEFTINAVNNPFNRVVTYSIEGLEDTEYQITEDGDNLKVNVSVPGSYTLKAISAPDNEYRDGFAIMRLNVFRHLAVYVDGEVLAEDAFKTDVASTLTFDVPDNAYLYYRIIPATPAPEVYSEGNSDINQETGYDLYEDGINIPAKTSGNLEFYIANYGYKSPKRRIALSFTTGVEEIEGAEEAAARYYDLNGREVKGDKLDSGVYIRLQGGKAEKVLVK